MDVWLFVLLKDAHKASTLAGKSFKKGRGQQQGQQQQSPHSTVEYHHHHIHYHPLQRPIQPSPHQHDCVSTHDQPFTPDIFVEWASQFVPPVNPDIVVDQPHQCTISEHHHQNQPSYHAHTTKEDSLGMIRSHHAENANPSLSYALRSPYVVWQ